MDQVIEAKPAGGTTAHHYDGISAQLQGLDEISQDDLEGETDAFVGMFNT